MKRVMLQNLVRFAQPMLPRLPYQEAVDLASTADWWRAAFIALAKHRGLICRECFIELDDDGPLCKGCLCIAEDASEAELTGDR